MHESIVPTLETLRRSLLFVPGAEPRKLAGAASANADTLVLDLEDSVAPDQKVRARTLVSAALRDNVFGAADVAVRVNSLETPEFAADVEAVVRAGCRTLMIPKCQQSADLVRVGEQLGALEAELDARVRLLALVETARGVAQALQIADGSDRVDALCFGHADFTRDMGLCDVDATGGVAWHARCEVAIAARAADLSPIDTVHLEIKDATAFRDDVLRGQQLGFEGKLCIHPTQVAIVNEVYTPTATQISYAERVIAAWEEAQASGRGVFALDGTMVDAPVIAAQRRVLARARRAGLS